MVGWIHASRLVAILLMALVMRSDLATQPPDRDVDAEAAPVVTHMTSISSRGGPRPPVASSPPVEALVARLRIPTPPTPTPPPATLEPSPTLTPQPRYEDLGLFKITGYSDGAELNGTDGRGITKSGEKTHWGVVAVDPRIIPLGSKILIEGLDGTVFTALDTGGGIKGRRVDVWYSTDWDALQHGVREMRVLLVRE